MKKINFKSVLTAICSIICAVATVFAVGTLKISAKAETPASVTVSNWSLYGTCKEIYNAYITFAGFDGASDGYIDPTDDANDNIYDYIKVNGKTISEINETTSVDGWNWEQFPQTEQENYRKPIIGRTKPGILRLRIHKNLFDAFVSEYGSFKITVCEGFTVNGYTVDKETTYVLRGNEWEIPTPETDITASLSAEHWIDQAEYRVTYISVGEGVIPSGVHYSVSSGAWSYLQDYLLINGKKISEINADTTLGASEWNYTIFPASADSKYKLPVILFAKTDDSEGNYLPSAVHKIEIKIHDNYLALLGDSVTITVKAGFSIQNGENAFVVSQDTSFVVWGEVKPETTDISANITAKGWDITGDAQELTYTRLSLGAGVLPTGLAYDIMDKEPWQYVQEYITINGKTVKEINEQTDTSSYDMPSFPWRNGGVYAVPVILYLNGEKLEVKVHNDYITSLGEIESVVIGVKAGLIIENGETVYEVKQARNITVWGEVEITTVDISANITAVGWSSTGDKGELTYTRLLLGAGVLPAGLSYDIMDKAPWKYIQEYITINGKTVKEINEQTDTSSYDMPSFPWRNGGVYAVPVILYLNGEKLEVKVHNDYITSLGEIESVVIGVKAGLIIENGETVYEVKQAVEFTVWELEVIEEIDILDNISVAHWITQSEYKVTYLAVGKGVISEKVDYDVTSGAYYYLQNYIYINGRAISEINADTTLGASEWNYTIFPATADPKYKLPVILFAKTAVGDVYSKDTVHEIEIKIHENYLAILGDDIEITAKQGLYFNGENCKYVLSKDVEYVLSGKVWADKNKKHTVSYYLNGDLYGDPIEVLHNSALVLIDDPEVAAGYFFSGWEYPPTPSIVGDMEINGYIRPIEYTVIYHLDGGNNNSQNPIVYFVTDGEVVLKDAVKEGYTFKGWYTSADYTQKVETLNVSTLDDIELYALFEQNGGCSSSVLGGDLLAVALMLGAVILVFKAKAKANALKNK